MKTYYKNGIETELDYILSGDNEFAIQVDENSVLRQTFYKNDTLIRDMENYLIDLYDIFRDIYFPDTDNYYLISKSIPPLLQQGGYSSDFQFDSDFFNEIYNKFAVDGKHSELNKFIYVADCQYLISTLQNLTLHIEYCFTEYFIQISKINNIRESSIDKSGVYFFQSEYCTNIAFLVESFFTKLYSILDIIVKIVYELENPVSDFSSMKKLNCADKLWGDKKKLKIYKQSNTIFEDDYETVKTIETIRNECIHNGTWENFPKVFAVVENYKIIERYMLFPDCKKGRFCTVKNRRHFYSQGLKVNDVLIQIHDDFYKRLITTLNVISKKTVV